MNSRVIVAVAQINCTVGDLEGNSRRIVDAARRAAAAGADVLLTPELSLTGYPPEDLLLRPGMQFHVLGNYDWEYNDQVFIKVSPGIEDCV